MQKVSYNNKLTELLKLQQVANGFVKTNEGDIVDFKTNAKLNEVNEYNRRDRRQVYYLG